SRALKGQPWLRLRRYRSFSDSPPHTPNLSSCASAYSRHGTRPSHAPHSCFASRVDEPGAGKKNSGPAWAHSAVSCQESSWSVVVLIGMPHTFPRRDKHRINEASTSPRAP